MRYTLVPDGLSDRALLRVLDWLIEQHTDEPFESQFAETLPSPSTGLSRRVAEALRLYPCDILFVHRDAESAGFEHRKREIEKALNEIGHAWVPVIPVRMTEAWLLSDFAAIRIAADNPAGKSRLAIPARHWDRLPDPKRTLREALIAASGLSGRRLARFSPDTRRVRVAQLTDDFSRLRELGAFRLLEAEVIASLQEVGVARPQVPDGLP